jgi:hypothetical protein
MRKFVLVVDTDKFSRKDILAGTADGILRIGNPIYHRDLVFKHEVCLGGGDWEIKDDNEMALSGSSGDFGVPKFGQVKNVLIDAELKKYKIEYTYPCYYPYKEMGDNGVEHISDNATFIEDLDF